MDQELIRKAAEAMHQAVVIYLHEDPDSAMVQQYKTIPFSEINPFCQETLLRLAEAALKVFLEHTRAQPREGHGVRCQDCDAAMTPTVGSPNWTCHSCGKTV